MSNGERDLVELGRLVSEAQGTEKDKPFARRAGISPELLWQIKNARRRDGRTWGGPTAPNVQAVARAAGIPEDKALSLAGYNPSHFLTPVDSGPPLKSETALAEEIRDLTVQDRRAVEHLVGSLRERRALEQRVDELLRQYGYIASADAPVPPVVHVDGGLRAPDTVESVGGEFETGEPAREPAEDHSRG